MRKLKRLLRPLKDPRADNTRHDLLDIVIIALAATLAGARSCTEFEFFGHGRLELLRRFLELRHGIPSHDTFSNVLRALDPKGLETVLRKFSKGFAIKGVVSIDGKALRGAFTRGSIWTAPLSPPTPCIAGPTRRRPSAIGRGTMCWLSKAIAASSSRRSAHCSTRPEGRRGRASDGPSPTAASSADRLSSSRHQSWRNNTASPASLPSVALTAGAPTGARPPSTRSDTFLPRACCQPRSCSRSCAPTGASRTTFWVLDVLFDEDACRSRKDHAAENLALIRKLILNILEATPGPARISHKMLKAKWDNDFLLTALGHMR